MNTDLPINEATAAAPSREFGGLWNQLVRNGFSPSTLSKLTRAIEIVQSGDGTRLIEAIEFIDSLLQNFEFSGAARFKELSYLLDKFVGSAMR